MTTIDDAKQTLSETPPKYRWARRLRAGVTGGAASAAVMAMLASVGTAANSHEGFALIEMIAATFMSDAVAAHPGWSAVVGVGAHVLFGAGLGVIFAALTRSIDSLFGLVASGLLYGALIFLVMTYAVLPAMNPALAETLRSWWFVLYHLAFGLGLPLSLYVPKWLSTPREVEHHA
jgi:hypothetical protein